jgi:hypothetical protein
LSWLVALVESYRNGAIPSGQIGLVLDKWDKPEQEDLAKTRSLWRLQQAYTAVMRDRVGPEELVRRTMRLHGILDAKVEAIKAKAGQ